MTRTPAALRDKMLGQPSLISKDFSSSKPGLERLPPDLADGLAITEGAPDGVDLVHVRIRDMGWPAILCGHAGRQTLVNGPAAVLLGDGAPRDVWGAPSPGEAATVPPCLWQGHCTPGEGWSAECRVKGREGAPLDLRLVAIPVRMDGDGANACLVLIENQTEARIHARELEIYAQELSQIYQTNQEHLQRLEASEKSREHFFGLVSHELKTPLTSLLAAEELLVALDFSGPDADRVRQLTATMQRSTNRLRRLINDLLDLAQAQSGALSLDIGKVDMVEVITAVVEEMAPFVAEKQLSMVWHPSLRYGCTVRGDEVRLQQIVQNLLSNAIKAAPVGGAIRIALGCQNGQALVTVTSFGVRLDPAIKENLFQPFRKSSAGNYKAGAGLGLTVVSTLVRAHGGTVQVHAGRKNTAFAFSIPLCAEESQR